MFVLSSPSGAGKTTITQRLRQLDDNLRVSISATTRVPRLSEVDGQDYYFMDQATFQHYIDKDKFLEHAKVFDNYYGTLKEPVLESLQNGYDVLFDVDWQGAQVLTHHWRSDLVKLFILPPSFQELERRLYNRNQDPKIIVDKRMAKAAGEISHWAEYDYVLINNSIEECVQQVYAILTAERYKKERQYGLVDFVRNIMLKDQ